MNSNPNRRQVACGVYQGKAFLIQTPLLTRTETYTTHTIRAMKDSTTQEEMWIRLELTNAVNHEQWG